MIECVDFGCGEGRTLPRNGVGVDILRSRIARDGRMVVVADETKPVFRPKSVRYATLIHTLEHLPSLHAVEAAVNEAMLVATEYVHIIGPWFDSDDYLASLGLNLYWSSWPGHTTHLTTSQLSGMLPGCNFKIGPKGKRILGSGHPSVHLAGYEAGGPYIQGEHPEKPFMKFDVPVYPEMECRITL